METKPPTDQSLLAKNEELRARLEEAEEKLRPILAGEVDTLVIDGPDGHRIYTLQGLDAESNRFRGEMLAQVSDDGLLLLGKDWRCTYCNEQGARMIGRRVEQLLGQSASGTYSRTRWARTLRPAIGAPWRAVSRSTSRNFTRSL